MTAITKIVINGQNRYNMGSECTDDDAEGYRDWLFEELAKKFPDADIDINEENGEDIVECDAEWNDFRAWEEAKETVSYFCEQAWDRCPWSWVKRAG